jgi:outer membrane receptor protein involved in Fe transport
MDPGSAEVTNRLQVTDLLPSVNLTYMVTDMANIRVAYSHSVNRPEFRERSTTIFEDFLLNELIAGNPSLSRAYVRNYDARIEVFPGIGEVFAVSYFQKIITGAIEEQLLLSGTRTRVFFNSERASNHGVEIEFRKSFGFLGGYFNAFSMTGNYSRIFSSVRFTETVGNSSDTRYVDATRPMQGQSPYMINLSFLFTEPSLGTTLNVLYNTAGRRLHTVGFLASDIYEEARDMVDLSLSQPIARELDLKVTVRNLGAKPRVLTRDGQRYDTMSSGRTFAFQLTYTY